MAKEKSDRPLEGQVALVAGATRGAGRAIACALAEAGAYVYATGRSTRAGRSPTAADSARRLSGQAAFDLSQRPETIEETEDRIRSGGGQGVGLCVDHSDQGRVIGLIDRIRQEQGRLDLLINDIWGGEALVEWGKPFWDLDPAQGQALIARAVHTHAITSRHAVPLMIERRSGLVVEVTDGDALYYRSNLYYDLAKVCVMRMAFAMAEELRPQGVAALAVTPGFLRSEAMLDHLGVTEANWRDAIAQDPHFAFSETPHYVARGLVALAADPERMADSGRVHSSWSLSRRYGITDLDGSAPDWGAHAAESDFGRDQRGSHDRFVAGCAGPAEPAHSVR